MSTQMYSIGASMARPRFRPQPRRRLRGIRGDARGVVMDHVKARSLLRHEVAELAGEGRGWIDAASEISGSDDARLRPRLVAALVVAASASRHARGA
jgi:hypothetical protein